MSKRGASTNLALVVAGVLALSACDVTHMALPAHPSSADQALFNEKLAGRSAVVTFRKEDLVEREAVRAVRFDGEGNLGLGESEFVRKQAGDVRPAFDWTYVPAQSVIEVSTVDHGRGAIKGFLYGALAGFVPVTIAVYVANRSCPSGDSCENNGVGNSLGVGVLVGLVVATLTGLVGAAIGAGTGDGKVVTFVPDAPAPVAVPAPLGSQP